MFKSIVKSKVATSLFWVAFEKFGYSSVYFLATLVLARLLTPRDFGVIGVLAVFVSFSQMIVESGFGGALVKKKTVSDADYNTIFTFNVVCSIILYIILFLTAPLIAKFYNNPILSPVTRAVGLNIIIVALTLTQRVHLIRELAFRKQSIISISALSLSVIIAVIIAYKGFGVWALVFQQLFYNMFYFIFIFFTVKYYPKLKFVKSSFSEMYGFGSRLFASSLLTVLYNEGMSSVIAKVYSLNTTGFYYQAKKLVDFPISIFRAIGDNVVFPMLSKEEDSRRFAIESSKLMKIILFVSFPFFAILFFFSRDIVNIVLGSQWSNSAPMLKILCLSSLGMIIDTVSRNILKATGHGKIILRSELIKKAIEFILVIIFVRYNLTILLYSIVAGNFIGCIINMFYVNVVTEYKFYKQVKDVVPIIFVAGLAGFLGTYAVSWFELSRVTNFLAGSSLILFIYFIICLSFLVDKALIDKIKKRL
ncbi:teichuronic acid exporter [Pedobacter sp. UYP30]|uniref:lipopolysaccharide biosynthesis protein n=1 Tax=Pedobacter sp. UYP30 TaxID=1756400 RepID=UPI003390890A